jgi:hypothetical protein
MNSGNSFLLGRQTFRKAYFVQNKLLPHANGAKYKRRCLVWCNAFTYFTSDMLLWSQAYNEKTDTKSVGVLPGLGTPITIPCFLSNVSILQSSSIRNTGAVRCVASEPCRYVGVMWSERTRPSSLVSLAVQKRRVGCVIATDWWKAGYKVSALTADTWLSKFQNGKQKKSEKCWGVRNRITGKVKGKKGKVVPLRSIEAHLGERRYSSYSFLTSALEGGEWSASRPGRALPPWKEPPVPIV